MSERLETIVERLNGLTLREAAELSKMLQDRWGISAVAPAVVENDVPAPIEEQTEFYVVLKKIGPKKIPVIKAVRTFRNDLGLKEARDLVDKAPTKVLEGVSKDQAESAANVLIGQGAVVELE